METFAFSPSNMASAITIDGLTEAQLDALQAMITQKKQGISTPSTKATNTDSVNTPKTESVASNEDTVMSKDEFNEMIEKAFPAMSVDNSLVPTPILRSPVADAQRPSPESAAVVNVAKFEESLGGILTPLHSDVPAGQLYLTELSQKLALVMAEKEKSSSPEKKSKLQTSKKN